MFSASFTKLIAGFGVVALAIAGIFFRADISRMLNFGSQEPKLPVGLVPIGSSDDSAVTHSADPLPQSKSAPDALPAPAAKPPLAAYVGRDPSEVRPTPSEVAVFSEDRRNQIYEAIKAEGNMVKASPRMFDVWIHLGILKKNIGDFEGARDAWEYAGVIEPLNSLSFANLGELYWHYLRDYPRAEKSLRISIAHKPNDPATFVTLADVYHYSYKEKSDLADDVLLEGLEKNPGDESLMRHLAFIFEARGSLSDALVWWEKVLLLRPDDSGLTAKVNALKEKLAKGS